MTRWQVHKFGGTSVLNAERIAHVADIVVDKLPSGPKAVVVSAMKGVTDDLLRAVHLARLNDAGLDSLTERIHGRHVAEIEKLLSGQTRSDLLAELKRDMHEVREILRGIWLVRSASQEIEDSISGRGEVWSARILDAVLRSRGLPSDWLDAREVLVIQRRNQRPEPDWNRTRALFADWRKNRGAEMVVVTGFVARLESGAPATLGRNGSDFSASIFGELFDCEEIFIWTDVDGILSADPRRVPEAVVLDEMSYNEVAELAYFGAQVVHPATLTPAVARGSSIWIKNTFKPGSPGTKIHAHSRGGRAVKAFSAIDGMSLLNLEGSGLAGVPGVAERLFGALRGAGVSVVLISQGSSEHSICLAIPTPQSKTARDAVEEEFALDRQRGLVQAVQLVDSVSILAAVGDNMALRPGVAGEFFASLGLSGVNVRAIAQGSSERNISAVIDTRDSERALRAVHSAFILPRHRLAIGLIGPGLIGSTFMRQLAERGPALKKERQIDFQVLAIADSRRMVLSDTGLAPCEWKAALEIRGQTVDMEKFAAHLRSSSIPHAAIIEATASGELARHYPAWLRNGLHVITPNKKANAGPIEEYHAIRAAALAGNRRFLYSTNVGAGLPLIQALRDLRATGDEVHLIQGLLSGTLSYLFTAFDGARPFSSIVADARTAGYTEPDPRDDLSGQDVARKLVILAREAGLEISLDDLHVENLVPEPLRKASREEFLARLSEMDNDLLGRLNAARSRSEVLRYVASVDPAGRARVELLSVAAHHAFARVSGTDNMVLFKTKRYFDQPLVIQGPGAGPEVTAAGVFADLLRLAAYLGAAL